MDDGDEAGFPELLDYIKRSRGYDFGGYKPRSLIRRIHKRMLTVGQTGFAEYIDYLEVHPEEFSLLFDTILINVTTFFRDPAAWEYLAAEVIPRILESKPRDEPVRVWSAGCASGEEAYTLSIVLAEALGVDAFRERVKVYATDIDEGALVKARAALYEPREMEGVPQELREKYFEQANHRFGFQKELRRSVIFGRHDLIQDAPISRIDLLVCRNTLMYFNSETQSRILDRFHFALADPGYLFLGKAETLLTYSNSYHPVDMKRRIFAKVSKGHSREQVLTTQRGGNGTVVSSLVNHVRLREAVFEAVPLAQIVVDQHGFLILANGRARLTFRLTPADLGRPLQDLEISYRPVELRSCIERAVNDRKSVAVRDVDWPAEGVLVGPNLTLDLLVVPLFADNGSLLGTSVTFTDVTGFKKLQAELQVANRELETAYEELQSTNEELETTNEELQSTIEELETTNEELQSTNEELETMNEELQSTNEELQTLNEELRQRGEELNEVNGFLESILRSFRGAVIVVDRNLLIQVWNHRAEELWGLRSHEVDGKPLLNLDIGLPVEQLKQPIKACLAGEPCEDGMMIEATNRRGRPIRCEVTCAPLRNVKDKLTGAILLLSEQEVRSARAADEV